MIEPAQGAFDFEIEADVFVRNREASGEETQGVMERTRNGFSVNLREAERTKGIVAGEEFIAPIATEGDGDFRPRKPAEQPSREE